MNINLIVFATPFFILSILIGSWVSYKKNTTIYRLNDSVNNLSTGILEEVSALPVTGLILYSYHYLSTQYPLLHISTHSLLSWLILWPCVDFCYYWYHRCSHRCTFLWIGHSVHHQSEHYNLSVALRQSFFQTITSWVFFLPLALIGFPISMFVIVYACNTIYQFWIHTQSIRQLGWLEYVFNTPSHHRVHHGKNPQYIDKNYAGSLIIWDKLFGTFEPEQAPVEYGVTEPLDSWNPFYANIKVIQDVLYYGQFLKNKGLIIKAFIMPPEWIIQKMEQEGTPPIKKPAAPLSHLSPRLYMLWNMAMVLFLYAYLALTFSASSIISWIILSAIFLTMYIQGHTANQNQYSPLLEIVRTCLIFAILYFSTQNKAMAALVALIFHISNYFLFQKKPYQNNPCSSQFNPMESRFEKIENA